jgi:CheY-like chemotaxis protein
MASILVCDDETYLREMITIALTPLHQVREACDGIEGVEFCRQEKFDLIITDLTMPNMSGLELIEKIRSLNYQVKIIAISGLLHLSDIAENTLRAGADICLAKPVSIQKLESAINELLT